MVQRGPFPTGVPVEGEEFIGRQKEFKEVFNLLSGGQSVILVSPRRFGKTSLIIEVLKKLKKHGFFTADIDLFAITTKRELAKEIVENTLSNRKGRFGNLISRIKEGLTQALQSIEIKSVLNEFEFILSFIDPKVDEDELLGKAMDFPQVFAKREGREMIFSFDEFGDILKLDGEALIKKMRAKFQRQRNTTYLFAGSQVTLMKKLFFDEKQAFYRFGRYVYLDKIKKEDFMPYIQKTFLHYGIKCGAEPINEILNITLGHPYYTQLICQKIFYLLKDNKSEVCSHDIKEGLIAAIISERAGFDALWEKLSKRKYDLLIFEALAQPNTSPYAYYGIEKQKVYQSLSSLIKNGYLKSMGKGEYEIADPLFREYIKLRKAGKVIL